MSGEPIRPHGMDGASSATEEEKRWLHQSRQSQAAYGQAYIPYTSGASPALTVPNGQEAFSGHAHSVYRPPRAPDSTIVYHQSQPYRDGFVNVPFQHSQPQQQMFAPFVNVPAGRAPSYYQPASQPTPTTRPAQSSNTPIMFHPMASGSGTPSMTMLYQGGPPPGPYYRPVQHSAGVPARPPVPAQIQRPMSNNQSLMWMQMGSNSGQQPAAQPQSAVPSSGNVQKGAPGQPISKTMAGFFALDEKDLLRAREIHHRIEQYVQKQQALLQRPSLESFSGPLDVLERLLPYHLLDPWHMLSKSKAQGATEDADQQALQQRKKDLQERAERQLKQISSMLPHNSGIGATPIVPIEVSILHTRIGLQLEREALSRANINK